MKILVIADIHGDYKKLSKVIEKERGKFDAIVAPGDFTDMYKAEEGFSQMEIGELIIYRLLSQKKPLFAVPGNHDPYGILEVFNDYNINIHAEYKEINGIAIMGWGGAVTPFDTKFEPTEEETDEYLNSTYKKMGEKKFILVVHNPPYDTELDKIEGGRHVGSKAIRKFIEKAKPLLVISAHIHESGGHDKIGNTPLFYPGAVFEGKYGIISLTKTGKAMFEIKEI